MNGEAAAQAFLEAHVGRVGPLEDRYAQVSWRFATNGGATSDEVAEASAALRRAWGDPAVFDEVTSHLKAPSLAGPTRRQLEIAEHACAANRMAPEALENLARLEARVEDRFIRFRAPLEGEAVSDNELRGILLHDDDVPLRQAAWEASKAIGLEVEGDVRRLAHLRNAEARRLGHADFFAMSLARQEIDPAWLEATLTHLEAASHEAFFALKARLDGELRRRFKVAASADLRPWHYADPFFQMLPPASDGPDLDPLFEDVDQVEVSRRFFGAIGLPVEDILDVSDLFERDGKNQHAFCTRLNRGGDVRILTNLRQDEGWTATLLHELGHAVYDKGLPQGLPWLLRDVSHALTTEAVALMFERMTHHGPWLRTYLGISDAKARRIGGKAARALAESQLIFCRWCLVMVRFEQALYRDPDQDLHSIWWRLVEELQGVKQPPGRQAADWASKIHVANVPVYYQNYLIGELVASQLWGHLSTRVVAEAKDPASALTDDPRVGAFFQERVFGPGASLPWMDHIDMATGHALDPRHYVALMQSARI